MDFIETEVDYYAIDVGFSTVIVHDENGIEPDATFVRKDALDRIAEENARLRAMLQDLAICACGRYCHGCPHQYDGCNRDQRLRELGIEV